MLHRRLASLLVTVTAAGLAVSGCSSPNQAVREQSAAVRVDDRTVSRSNFEDSLEAVYENEDLLGFLFQGATSDQLRPEDGLTEGFNQEYVAAMARMRVEFLIVAEALESEGIVLTADDRRTRSDDLQNGVPEFDSLPSRFRDDLVEGLAGIDKLRAELGDDFNVAVGEVVDRVDISVSSRYGSWDDDEFAVLPPSGPASAPGADDASALAPG